MPHPECSLCCTAIPPTLPNDFPDTTPDAMALSRPLRPFPVFRTCNVRSRIGLSRTFNSGRVTSGNCQTAFQAPLWHFPVFRTCNVGKSMNALLCSYDSCSKSFGESTPSREAYKAHRSPNDLGQGPPKVAQSTLAGDTRILKGATRPSSSCLRHFGSCQKALWQ